MFEKIIKRLKSNNGMANTIEMIFIMLLLFQVTITIIDTAMFFNNRYMIGNAAQNGARLAAVFGGTTPNSISKQYGITGVDYDCKSFGANNPVSCSVYKELKTSKNTVSTTVTRINCGPGTTNRVGDRTYCEVNYKYKGLPGSGLSLIQLFGDHQVRMTAESEVVHK